MKVILMIILMLLPNRIKILAYRVICGFEIAHDARIGMSLILCKRLVLGNGALIGHLNVIRGDMTLVMEAKSSIGQFNWITGGNSDSSYFVGFDRQPQLTLGEESSITSRHILDCTDKIEIGRLTTIAGYRTTILTHSIDYTTSKQTCGPVRIGDFCLIGSGVTILMGVTIPNRTILGSGTIVPKPISKEMGLWIGAPARLAKQLSGNEAYFSRQNGHIY